MSSVQQILMVLCWVQIPLKYPIFPHKELNSTEYAVHITHQCKGKMSSVKQNQQGTLVGSNPTQVSHFSP